MAIMKVAGDRARKVIDNFMKAFPEFEIEYVVADLQLKATQIKGTLQIKIKPNP